MPLPEGVYRIHFWRKYTPGKSPTWGLDRARIAVGWWRRRRVVEGDVYSLHGTNWCYDWRPTHAKLRSGEYGRIVEFLDYTYEVE